MSLNSKSIKDFFFYNIEKVILCISLLLLGAFFYLGMSSKKYNQTPDSLVSESQQASSYINKAANWEMISDFRAADTDIPERIERAKAPVDSSKFLISGMSIIPKALQLRTDPPLPEVVDLEAKVIRATVAVRSEKRSDDAILDLPIAKAQIDPDEEDIQSSMGMGGMSGMGGMGDEMEDMMDMDAMSDMRDAMAGAMGGGRTKKKKEREREKDPQDTAEVDGWSGLPGVQRAVIAGIDNQLNGISAGNAVALKRNVVVVNALVNHRELWQNYSKMLSNSVSYYPKRDLPQYEFLQVERRKIGGDKPGEWEDKSEWVNFEQAEYNPGSFVSGPEVVPPAAYDRNLTNAIPAMLGFDYLNYVLHSKLTPRVFKFPEKEEEAMDVAGLLSGTVKKKEEEEEERRRRFGNANRNTRREKGTLVTGGGGGMGMGMGGGMDMMDYSDMEDSMGGMGMYRSNKDGRSSSDMTEYSELADPTVEPAGDFKAIRFFDMQVAANQRAQYEYRVRLWLKDPNATDPEATRNNGMMDRDDMGGGMQGMMGMNGDVDINGKKIFKKTDINFTMQDQAVRDRLKRSREERDEKGMPVYFVSEVYPGDDMPTEVKVPTGFEYLRFARPTKWSQPVSVTVNGPEQEFFAESVEESRTAEMGGVDVPIDEPAVALVTEVEGADFNGIELAAKKEFHTGDMINFAEPITIMHPLARSVHFMANADFNTNATLVDVMGGKRLDVPRNDPIQYDLPGESLVMTPDGEFRISNDIDDRTFARAALRLPDEKAEYGRKKRKKRKRPGRDGPGGANPFGR